MIASLTGRVQHTGADHVVLDVNGVGYLVHVSLRTADRLRPQPVTSVTQLPEDKPIFLFIETQVREDSITLNGFLTAHERDWFRRFTSIQGVGSKVAFSILATIPPDELTRVITLEDRASISRANGVGPRLASRILTELKGKDLPGPGTALGSIPGQPAPAPIAATASLEAISALQNLGFRPPEAMRAVAEAERDLGTELPVSSLIREALKRASR